MCCYLYGEWKVYFEMPKIVQRKLFLSQIYLQATFNA
jgi:hypothetical protein